MNLLLKNYIKKYLLEGVATKHSADAIKVQSFLSKVGGSSSVDKTNYSLEETLEDIVTNIKDELFISFVDEYDENVPRLETNPNVTYDTPHGIYAYPLTYKTLAELRNESSIKGATFAINRKYMHLFTKSRGVNSVDINPDGSNNYSGNLQRDKITMIKSAIMLTTSKSSGQEYKNYIQRKNKERFEGLNYSKKNFDSRIKEIENITLDIARKNLNRVKNSLKNNPSTQEYDVIHHIVLVTNILSCISLVEKSVTKSKDLDLATEIIYDVLENVTFSDENTHYRKYGNKMSDFHILMTYAYFLSMPIRDSKMSLTPDGGDDPSLGTYFTVLLDEIGINMVNDKGTGTIHRNEPLQAFYLNTSKRLRIKHIGTYKNIFYHKHAPIDFDNAFLGYNIKGEYPTKQVLAELLKGNLVGVANGRAEYGPRALGNRSLLADPRGKDIKQKMNTIKNRQEFRPFAPSVLEEHAHEIFDMPTKKSQFMQYVAPCKYPDKYPAICHIDNTSRVQTVSKKDNPGYYNLIKEFYKQTGCPMVLNTSLNIKGQPIVNDENDADEFTKKYGVKVYR